MQELKIVIAASVCNCVDYIDKLVSNITIISSLFSECSVILIESDSSDGSPKVLSEKLTNSGIENIVNSLGELRSKIFHRTGRISYARNTYLDIIEHRFNDWDYVLVMDFNDSNIDQIDPANILSNFKTHNWDMVCANQRMGYYDLWALRHPKLMPHDCWKMARNFDGDGRLEYVYSKFFILPEDMPWVKVDSAFGGAAFIKISSIQGARHDSINSDGEEECEWVSFCKKLNGGNPNIFINPKFYNQITTKSRHIP
jgi:hypothetical protein